VGGEKERKVVNCPEGKKKVPLRGSEKNLKKKVQYSIARGQIETGGTTDKGVKS